MGCGASSKGKETLQEAEGANGVLTVGVKVQTQYCAEEGGDDQWYEAKVMRIRRDRAACKVELDLLYDDGDKWTGSPVWIYRMQPENDQSRAARLREKIKVLLRAAAAAGNPAAYQIESEAFDKHTLAKVNKIPENWDFSGRYEMFDGCRAIDEIGDMMQQLEEASAGRGWDPQTQRRVSSWYDGIEVMMRDSELQKCCLDVARPRLEWALTANTIPALRYTILNAKQLHAESCDQIQPCLAAFAKLCLIPKEWELNAFMNAEFGYRMLAKASLPPNSPAFQALQRILDDSFVNAYTRDRGKLANDTDAKGLPTRLVLARAEQVQNIPNFREYCDKRALIKSKAGHIDLQSDIKTMNSLGATALPELDSSINECWLYHGTKAEAAVAITTTDFKLSYVGTRAGTLYGNGIYLAEACTKSDEYTADDGTGLRPLILCRCTLGKLKYTDEPNPNTKELENACASWQYHSVLGDREKSRGTYREFIVYKEDQVYPAYVLWYKRDYSSEAEADLAAARGDNVEREREGT